MNHAIPSISEGDYALLNAVCLDPWGVWLMAREKTMAGINMPFHNLAEDELADHLFRLWELGLVEFSTTDEFDEAANPDSDLVRRVVRAGNPYLAYRLTLKGGETWEHFASPDWSKFFSSHIGSDATEWILSASSRVPIEVSLRCHRVGPIPLAGTERWEVLKPWQATYWKRLPVGHRLTYRFESWNHQSILSEDEIKAEAEFSPWWGAWQSGWSRLRS